ncbi:hypothetical protein AYO38_10725 [bacterium SCGC AG-212-C10]|nr:hypothetical protein AYO38_10725 [bacterium SCGC AG-212-C10]
MVHRLRWLLPAFALFVAAIATGAFRSDASALTNCSVTGDTLDAEESAFLAQINSYRQQSGLQPLLISTNLNRASAWLAVDMPAKSYFSHTDSLGRSPSQRAVDCGYPGGAGENIAAGTVRDTGAEAFEAWRASSGHNANMLNASYRQIGIARYYGAGSTYGWYWVTDFGLVNDGTGGGGAATATSTASATRTTVAPTATRTSVAPTATRTSVPPSATATQPSISKAVLTSPTPGSVLPGSSATFAWTAGAGAAEYFLYVGTSPGANNVYGRSTGLNRAVSVSNLPTNSRAVYFRLWTRLPNGWQFTDYTYTAASGR